MTTTAAERIQSTKEEVMKRRAAKTVAILSPRLRDEPTVFLQQELGEEAPPRALRVVIDSGIRDAAKGDVVLAEVPGDSSRVFLTLNLRTRDRDEQDLFVDVTVEDANDIADAFTALAKRAREMGILPTRET